MLQFVRECARRSRAPRYRDGPTWCRAI